MVLRTASPADVAICVHAGVVVWCCSMLSGSSALLHSGHVCNRKGADAQVCRCGSGQVPPKPVIMVTSADIVTKVAADMCL